MINQKSVMLTTIIATVLVFAVPITYAVTEDDGWTEGDYQGSSEEQEEQAEDDWEDAGRPGDDDDDDDDDDSPNPYCDEVDYTVECYDRKDYDQETGLYPCNDGTQKTDWRDCDDASKSSRSSNNDNDIPGGGNTGSNYNGDDLPDCKKDVLQECKISGNTGLSCSVEDLEQGGGYNPNVIGDGHACHDVYGGTYNQLEYCNDGTYVVSCGSVGVYPGIP